MKLKCAEMRSIPVLCMTLHGIMHTCGISFFLIDIVFHWHCCHWDSVTLHRKETQKDAAEKFREWSKKMSWQTMVFDSIALFWGDLLRFRSAAVVDQQSVRQLPQFNTSSNSFLLLFWLRVSLRQKLHTEKVYWWAT